MTRQKLENFLYHAVELEDCNDKVLQGWFVRDAYDKNAYCLLPCNDIWHTYIYKISHIKRIKFLTNGFEVK